MIIKILIGVIVVLCIIIAGLFLAVRSLGNVAFSFMSAFWRR
jgi:hypothetical protein